MTTPLIFNSWVTYLQPNPQASLRLFCFPYAGGGGMTFRTWPNSLSATIEVCVVQLPGRGSRLQEAPFRQLLPLTQAIAQALLRHLDKPFAFFGHSMGAIISFELARQLRREHGLELACLFVSGRHAPQITDMDSLIYDLPESEFLEKLRRLNGTPKTVLEHPDLMRLMLPILRADFEVCQTYTYSVEPPLDCPICAFGGLQDHSVSFNNLVAWRDQTTASFSLWMLPGDHFFIHTYESRLLQILSQELHQLSNRAD